jgi:pimeloyl-ACP methyl ester carboxylesterase
VAALFEEHDLRDVVIVAYSMGSIVAVRYLTRLWHAPPSHARICRPNDAVPDEDWTILTPFRSPGATAKDFAK